MCILLAIAFMGCEKLAFYVLLRNLIYHISNSSVMMCKLC
uniref:Uncharacterized protein n=1 Tax=Arundo donax TaxID=35708 RepID=A0A0A8XPK5_ARUDO